MMGVNSPHYMGSPWPSNEGSYNWDAELPSSWNVDLNSVFSRRDNAGRESWALRFGHCGGVKTRASDSVFPYWHGIRSVPWASRLRHGLQALTWVSSFVPEHKVVLRHGLWALRLAIAVVLRFGLWALRFALYEWLWLASYLKHELCYLITCLQWFLDSLQNPLQSFRNSAVG